MGMKLGIDLGTSYSSIAANVDERIEMIRVATGASAFGDSFSMPSAIYIDEEGILLGQAALSKRRISPSNFKSEFKRDFGTTAPYVIAGEEYLPEQLYTEIFMYFKNQAFVQTGQKPESVFITYPANYGNNKKRLLEKAAGNAGLFNVKLVDEPTAAAAGYSRKNKIENGDILLVYDLGGGTFDTAIIKKVSDSSYIHLAEPVGISQCGGIDFDHAIFDDIMRKMSESGNFDIERLLKEKRFTAALNEVCVQIKHQLSHAQSHTEPIAVGFDYFDYTITRDEFENMIRPLVSNTCEKVKDIIRSAGLVVSDIDRVLLVGGSSRIPLVQKMVRETLKKDICFDADPELAICQGAAGFDAEPKPDYGRDFVNEKNTAERINIKASASNEDNTPSRVQHIYDNIIAVDIQNDEIVIGALEGRNYKILNKISTWDMLAALRVGECTITQIQSGLGAKGRTFGDMKLSAEEIYTYIFKEIKKAAESCIHKSVTEITLTIPAVFTYYQKAAAEKAARGAELEITRQIPVSSAAAVFYGYKNPKTTVLAVVDISDDRIEACTGCSGDDVFEVINYHSIEADKQNSKNLETVLKNILAEMESYKREYGVSGPCFMYITGKTASTPAVKNNVTEVCRALSGQGQCQLVFEQDRTVANKGAVITAGARGGKLRYLLLEADCHNYIVEINGERQTVFEAPVTIPRKESVDFNIKSSSEPCSMKVYISESCSKKEILSEEFIFDITEKEVKLNVQLEIDADGAVLLHMYDKDNIYDFVKRLEGSAV